MGSEKTQLAECTGWTEDEDIEYVGAMAEEDQGKCIHQLNRWCTGQLRWCSCPESWFFSWSEDNYIHRLNQRYIGWLPVQVTASFSLGQITFTCWTDDDFWGSVGLTGVRDFSGSFSPTAIFACAAYIYPHGRLSHMVGSLKSWRKCCPSKDPSPTILEVLSAISSLWEALRECFVHLYRFSSWESKPKRSLSRG